jgi:hypothetical protein
VLFVVNYSPQSAETTAPVCQQHVRPAISSTLRLRVRRILRLKAIRPFQLANAIGERLHRLRRLYQRMPPRRPLDVSDPSNHHEGHEAHEELKQNSISCAFVIFVVTYSPQSAGTTVLVCRRHAHPAASPTPHLRERIVLPVRSTPFSNLVDRRFHGPPSATPAKSESQ